jgi:hypothetical protein
MKNVKNPVNTGFSSISTEILFIAVNAVAAVRRRDISLNYPHQFTAITRNEAQEPCKDQAVTPAPLPSDTVVDPRKIIAAKSHFSPRTGQERGQSSRFERLDGMMISNGK